MFLNLYKRKTGMQHAIKR